jgi:hypothetical protein
MNHATILACLAAASSAAQAQLHNTDVILKSELGQVLVGRVEEGTLVYNRWVFSSELGKFGVPNATSDPGYDAEEGGMPINETVGVTIRKALRQWNGADFSTLPPERMEIKKSSSTISTPTIDPEDCGVGASLVMGKVTALGKIHQHPAYFLILDGGTPADGIYALELQAWITTPEQKISAPFWILFDQNADSTELQSAVDFQDRRSRCPADMDVDQSLTISDFITFQTLFAIGDLAADFDASCSLSIDDFIAFQTFFALGCE